MINNVTTTAHCSPLTENEKIKKKILIFWAMLKWRAALFFFSYCSSVDSTERSHRTIGKTDSFHNHSHNSQIISFSCEHYYYFSYILPTIRVEGKRSIVVLVVCECVCLYRFVMPCVRSSVRTNYGWYAACNIFSYSIWMRVIRYCCCGLWCVCLWYIPTCFIQQAALASAIVSTIRMPVKYLRV